MKNKISTIILNLHNYCEDEEYKGFNLLDSNLGIINFNKFGNKTSYIINQIFRRSPINFRSILGIPKTINPKAIGLFLNSYTKLRKYSLINREKNDDIINKLFEYLLYNYSKGYSGYCWGYQYDWPQFSGLVPANSPCSVVTGFIVRGVYTYFNEFKDYRAFDIISSASKFVLNDLIHTCTNEGCCISYNTIKQDLTLNASLLAAEILSYEDDIKKTKKNIEIIQQIINYVLHYQNFDGSWPYSIDIKTGKLRNQIDFHQGYIIESLMILRRNYELKKINLDNAINKGINFYIENQFKSNGSSFYRYPKYFPIDIHNQAQGIILFSKLSREDPYFNNFLNKVFDWTISNMYNTKGYFIYQKKKYYDNKISYMRWNQAWMFLALVEYYDSLFIHSTIEP